VTRITLVRFPPLLVLTVAWSCGADPVDRLAATAALDATSTPTPAAATPATPTPLPRGASLLVLSGDIAFEDRDPEVVVTREGERLRLELRHGLPGSALPDSTLLLLHVPARAGSYRLVSPAAGGSSAVQALFTTRSERVGSMKDFGHGVSGTLTLREESPGVLAGRFEATLQETPPPPLPPPKPGEPLPSTAGKVPPSPPASVRVHGSVVVVPALARPAPTPLAGGSSPR
jgi:hypothetical protein